MLVHYFQAAAQACRNWLIGSPPIATDPQALQQRRFRFTWVPNFFNLEHTSEGESSCTLSAAYNSLSGTAQVDYMTDEGTHEDFADKVGRLVCDLFPDKKDPVVRLMKGGGFNRVAAVDFPSTQRPSVVVRIPRFSQNAISLKDDAAILKFINDKTDLPAPRLLLWDDSSANAVGRPYMVQELVPGEPLYRVYPHMTHEERKSIVVEIAGVLYDMGNIYFSSIGPLKAASDGSIVVGDYAKVPEDPESQTTDTFRTILPETIEEFLAVRLVQLIALQKQLYPAAATQLIKLLSNAAASSLMVVKAMQISYSHNILSHQDFEARNIMVSRDEGGQYRISAILDWDNAAAWPIEAAYAMPSFLWKRSRCMNSTPAERQELKGLFKTEITQLIPDFVRISELGVELRDIVDGFSKSLTDRPDLDMIRKAVMRLPRSLEPDQR